MKVKQKRFQKNESRKNSAADPHYKKCKRKFFGVKENGTPQKWESTQREMEDQK